MKIKVGRYTLNSDKWVYWIEEEVLVEKGKHKGNTTVRNLTGYCWTFETCLRTFRERSIGQSEATTLLELMESLKRTFDDMDKLYKAAFEEDMYEIEVVNEREEVR